MSQQMHPQDVVALSLASPTFRRRNFGFEVVKCAELQIDRKRWQSARLVIGRPFVVSAT
jgi:hypothetical protein